VPRSQPQRHVHFPSWLVPSGRFLENPLLLLAEFRREGLAEIGRLENRPKLDLAIVAVRVG
jgi:hypothetical protein